MKSLFHSRRHHAAILMAFLFGPAAQAATPRSRPPTPDKSGVAAPPTHTISRGALKPKLQFDALLESTAMSPVKIELKAWTDLTVLEAVPHGSRVKPGDVLVKLDAEKLREQIDDLEQDRTVALLGLELAGTELENLEQTTPHKLETARRTQRLAEEDLGYFEKTGRAQKEKSTRFNVKSAEQRLEGANEELKQLKKMYEADDLTEETEEIILKRQKFSVEAADYGLETSRLSAEQNLTTTLPREHETLKAARRDQTAALALAEDSLPRTLAKKRLEAEKLRRDQRKSEKRLADLKKDLESLSVRAPAGGIVYYGACEAGKWPTGGIVAKKLAPTGKLTPNEVFMTIVNPDKLILRATVAESDLSSARIGARGHAAPIAAPDKKLPVQLEDLGSVPMPGGGFEARLSVDLGEGSRLMPGMSCRVSLSESRQGDALLAPKDAVFGEGEERHVFVARPTGKPEKRAVTSGANDGRMVEITDGLTAGEKILLQKPE